MPDSTLDTIKHIQSVQALLWDVCAYLAERGRMHDLSKLYEPEKSMYDTWKPRLRQMLEGSPEIQEARAAMGSALRHHYAANSHHPEHYKNGINDMSLLDVIEMLCDWKAACDEKGGVLLSDVQRERFGISDQLYAILENTVKELDW